MHISKMPFHFCLVISNGFASDVLSYLVKKREILDKIGTTEKGFGFKINNQALALYFALVEITNLHS